MTKTFYITFSQKYRTQEHPILPHIDPAGYITIQAGTYQEAVKLTHMAIGPYYDNITSEGYFDESMYTLGHLYSL